VNLDAIAPRRGNRVFIVGQTGTGKTTLTQRLLDYRRYKVLLDVKGTLNWPGYTVYRTLKTLTRAKEDALIYRPTHEDLNDDVLQDKFFEWCYLRRHCTVYVDEVMGVTYREELPHYYRAILTRGREFQVEMWSASQRPMNVPQVIMSESEELYTFRLSMPQDRKKIESMYPISADTMQGLDKHVFYYAPQDAKGPVGPLKLHL
jgi:hypothetical protein